MTAAFTIILPHLRSAANDEALRIALDCIVANTALDYELLIESVAEPRDIYPVCNRMAQQATADWLVFGNSDVFMAPGWAEPMYEARAENAIVTGVIVECGAIGVSTQNIHRNFGMTPQTYQRAAFEQWVRETPFVPDGEGWYFPSLHPRRAFLETGGFDTTRGSFPKDTLDIFYWQRWRDSGRVVRRVPSFSYHLQNYSNPVEQTKAVRL